MSEPKKFSLTNLVQCGYLQEVNRLFFHRVGLSLTVETSDDNKHKELYVQMARDPDDPEGWVFDEIEADKMGFVEAEIARRTAARAKLGCCDADGIQVSDYREPTP